MLSGGDIRTDNSASLPRFFSVIGNNRCKNKTLSLKRNPLTIMTSSMVLKFFSHRKHLARFVVGWVAVLNSLHTGHKNRKTPSLIFDGMDNSSLISRLTGIAFLNSNNSWDENRCFMANLSLVSGLITAFFSGKLTLLYTQTHGLSVAS